MLITCSEADRRLRVRNGTVSQAVRAGDLKGYRKPGGKWARVDEEELATWIRSKWAIQEDRPTA